MAAHAIFEAFNGYSGPHPAGPVIGWLGERYPVAVAGVCDAPLDHFEPPPPAVDEEYFEWLDLLTAVKLARDRFVMLELGAGYGRWGVRGALAARQRGIAAIDIRFVEAEPHHAAMIRESIALNGLDDIAPRIIEAAVSYAGEAIPFVISTDEFNALNWWGQSILRTASHSETEREYFGRPITRNIYGWDQIFVEPVTLEALVADLDRVDLIDADLQGAEGELVARAIDTLSAKVKRIHIGTHSPAIEAETRRVFTKAGWAAMWDFPYHTRRETPYGPVDFDDGVQSWVNPRL
jgi:FkbM family methyltransferase